MWLLKIELNSLNIEVITAGLKWEKNTQGVPGGMCQTSGECSLS